MAELGDAKYRRALRTDGGRNVRVSFTDQNAEKDDDVLFQDRVLEGEVQIDTTTDVSRQATVRLLDPEYRIRFDIQSRNAAPYAIYPGRFLRVEYMVEVTEDNSWVNVPVFTGPVTGFSREGEVVQIEGQGKEAYGLEPFIAWKTKTFNPRSDLADVVRSVANDLMGETRFAMPRNGGRIGRKLSIQRVENVWPQLKRLCNRRGFVLYFDGDGKLTMRPRMQGSPQWTFREGNDGDVLSQPIITYDLTTLRNTAQMSYEDRQNKQRMAWAVLDAPHPLAPGAIARHGTALHMASFWTTEKARTADSATRLARDALRAFDEVDVDIEFESLVIPHLDPYDRLAFTDKRGTTFRWSARTMTIGLAAEATMSHGIPADALRALRTKRRRRFPKP